METLDRVGLLSFLSKSSKGEAWFSWLMDSIWYCKFEEESSMIWSRPSWLSSLLTTLGWSKGCCSSVLAFSSDCWALLMVGFGVDSFGWGKPWSWSIGWIVTGLRELNTSLSWVFCRFFTKSNDFHYRSTKIYMETQEGSQRSQSHSVPSQSPFSEN